MNFVAVYFPQDLHWRVYTIAEDQSRTLVRIVYYTEQVKQMARPSGHNLN